MCAVLLSGLGLLLVLPVLSASEQLQLGNGAIKPGFYAVPSCVRFGGKVAPAEYLRSLLEVLNYRAVARFKTTYPRRPGYGCTLCVLVTFGSSHVEGYKRFPVEVLDFRVGSYVLSSRRGGNACDAQ